MPQKSLHNLGHIYAGLWKRSFAFLIDFVITIIPLLAIMKFTGLYKLNHEWTGVGINLIQVTLYWLYYSLLQSSNWQSTIGKKVLGLIVTDLNGSKISFQQASIRFLFMFLSILTLGVGFILISFNTKKQALHDKLARTVVLELHELSQTT